MLFFVFCCVFLISTQAGVLVDRDGDGLVRIMEDDGLTSAEDGQDINDCVPNLYLGDNFERFDVNKDGCVTIADTYIGIVLADNYLVGCEFRRDFIAANDSLLAAGLKSLHWVDLSFNLLYTTSCYKLP